MIEQLKSMAEVLLGKKWRRMKTLIKWNFGYEWGQEGKKEFSYGKISATTQGSGVGEIFPKKKKLFKRKVRNVSKDFFCWLARKICLILGEKDMKNNCVCKILLFFFIPGIYLI